MNDSDLKMAVKQLIDYYEKHREMMEAENAAVGGEKSVVGAADAEGEVEGESIFTALIDFTDPCFGIQRDNGTEDCLALQRNNKGVVEKTGEPRIVSASGSEATIVGTSETEVKGYFEISSNFD